MTQNDLSTGFRFPCNLLSRIYAVDPEHRRAVMIKYKGGSILELGILQELESGQLKTIAKSAIPCVLDDDCKLIGLSENSKKSVSYESLKASFQVNTEGFIELVVTHYEKGEPITDRFTS